MADAIFISVAANGHSTPDFDQVYLSFYGPRGGARTTQTVTTEVAVKLRDALARELGGGLQADMLAALKAVHEPYRHLTDEALEAGILMEFGPPKPEKGAALLMVRKVIAKAEPPAPRG
jgi:hypothetical protein